MSDARPPQDDRPSLWRDLVAGQLGFIPRLALSFTSAVLVTAGLLLGLAMIQQVRHVWVDDVSIGAGLAVIVWIGTLVWLWRGYPRYRRIIRATLLCLGIWTAVIVACVAASMATWEEEFWIAGFIFLGFAATFIVITASAYGGSRGRPIASSKGGVNVSCVQCGYSMMGLNDCTCPECGRRYTIDELIVLQDYEAIRRGAGGAPAPDAPSPERSQ
ncbi:MAG: hypothetical protein HRU76_02535 [Phycisphaeraceae bacterium]|nr:hypothetical protein [Phycisphaerales bacterium]QOJ16535.1 MAG: hypothetical protein HRU76_02535 [Phycisphaeraceae bacterium]